MSNVTVDDKELVQRAVKLLKLRHVGGGDAFKRAAIERKIQQLPDHVVELAQGRLAKEIKKDRAKKPTGGPRAKLLGATLTAEAGKSGHQMTFDMNVEIPKKAKDQSKDGEREFARDLYGVYFEWWEEIVVEWDFKEPPVDDPTDEKAVEARDKRIAEKKEAGEGAWLKPWSDIYLSNPTSQTFGSWKSSLQKASEGTLPPGPHTTGVQDRPALSPSADSFRRRTLRFRINAGDAAGEVFKGDAIQVIEIADGKVLGMLYQDSTGTELKTGQDVFDVMRYRSKLSPEIRHNEGSDFIVALESDKEGCKPFDNQELDQITDAIAQHGGELFYVHKDVNDSNKTYALPLIPSGDEYWEKASTDGGLLVAQLSGGKVKRLWHTDGSTHAQVASVRDARVTFTVRTFEQLPVS
ncbi:MAG TPA: hypothetical protein VFH58_03630 [Acidimicrobiales bacterium]|nr:hypothetical protein [Acidimicrobiales bacterium]